MKALRFAHSGSLANLALADVPAPLPAHGDVLVEVRAAGVNPSDVKNVLGRFPHTTLPRTPGRDFSGVVVQGPEELRGRAVWGTGKSLGFTRDGSHAELLALPATGVAPKPEHLSFAQAACGVPWVTAWKGLDLARAAPGDVVLVIGAGGAVGSAALTLATWRGARVVAAVRRADRAAALAARGVTAVVLGELDALPGALRHHGAGGVDVVFDTTGAWLAPAIGVLAQGGRVVVIAAPADGHVRVPVLGLYRRGGSIVGVNSLLYDATDCARTLTRIGAALDADQLTPPPEPRQFALADALEAYRTVDRGGSGRVVLVAGT